jgi:hypothetical protein
VSGVSAAAGSRSGQFDQSRNSEKANIKVRYSVYFKKDRAQRFYPSKFCGSTFDILRFAVPNM